MRCVFQSSVKIAQNYDISIYFMQISRIRGVQYHAFVYCSVYHGFRIHKICDFLSFPLVCIDTQGTTLHIAFFWCL